MGTPVAVSAALIWREGRFLICRRPPQKARGGLYEFVGGKVEPGETGAQALVRECREELDIEVEPVSVFLELVHTYPDMTVDLTLFNTRLVSGEPKMIEHTDIRWIYPRDIPKYSFCPADREILRRLMELSGGPSGEDVHPEV